MIQINLKKAKSNILEKRYNSTFFFYYAHAINCITHAINYLLLIFALILQFVFKMFSSGIFIGIMYSNKKKNDNSFHLAKQHFA